jgi:mannose-6-phosphate isomerase-like protein (cupin superfamily)
MPEYIFNLVERATHNNTFRTVVATMPNSQLVVMSLLPNEDIGLEIHQLDQILYVVEGSGTATVGELTVTIGAGSCVLVPTGMQHNVKNTGATAMKLFTIYAPAEHADGTVHQTKSEAEAAEKHS